MYVCNDDRSHFAVIEGMPWVIPFVLIIILVYSWLLSRTRTGRYIYAVGNNREAARRAGINVKWIVTFGFIMSGATAALAGVVYISQQGSVSTDIDGGTEVLLRRRRSGRSAAPPYSEAVDAWSTRCSAAS